MLESDIIYINYGYEYQHLYGSQNYDKWYSHTEVTLLATTITECKDMFLKREGVAMHNNIRDINMMDIEKDICKFWYRQIVCAREDCMKWLSANAHKSCLLHVALLVTLQSSITLPQKN